MDTYSVVRTPLAHEPGAPKQYGRLLGLGRAQQQPKLISRDWHGHICKSVKAIIVGRKTKQKQKIGISINI